MPLISIAPPRFHFGKVHKVHTLGRVEINLDLSLGVHFHSLFSITGFNPAEVPSDLHSAAMHAAVVLLGSKSVIIYYPTCGLIRNNEGVVDGCRIFLNERVHDPEAGLSMIEGASPALLDTGAYLKWLGTRRFDLQLLKAMLNGK